MDAREFAEWLAYDRLDPIGGPRLDILNGWLVAHLVAVFGGGSHDWTEYILDFNRKADAAPEGPENGVTMEKQEAFARAAFGMRGFRFIDKRKKADDGEHCTA